MKKIEKKMRDLINSLLEKTSHAQTIRLLIIGVNAWVFLNTSLLLPAHEHFWSEKAYLDAVDPGALGFIDGLTSLLLHSEWTRFYPFVIAVQLLAALSAIAGRFPVISQIAVLWSTLTLDQRAAVILDGGNNLIHLFLVYLVFMSASPALKTGRRWRHFRNGLANLSFLAARLQLVLVYLAAGLSKTHGDLWPKGVALYYTMNVEEYGTPFLSQLMSVPAMSVFASFSTLAFQISLPFLIWNRSLRPYYLAAGTLFHLGIAFGMGLLSFGFAMCTCYIVFYTDRKAGRILAAFGNALKSERLYVAFDENCVRCQRFASWVRLLDWRNRIVADGARRPRNELLRNIPFLQRVSFLCAWDGRRIHERGEVFFEIAKRLPLILPLAPLLYLAVRSGLGDFLYTRYCLRSGWREKCREGFCQLEETR